MRLVNGVDKGQADMARIDLELGQDGIAKGFRRDAGAVGDKKHGAIGHDARFRRMKSEGTGAV